MPALTNENHERMAQELAKGAGKFEAYQSAGFKGGPPAATAMANRSDVKARVAELLERAAKRTEITIADIASQLDDDREFAQKVKQAGAAVSATMGKAKVLGLLSDKVEHSGGVSITIAGRDTDL